MDAAAVVGKLRDFAKAHRITFTRIGTRHAQVLELAAFATVVEYYRGHGYKTSPRNLQDGKWFLVKMSSSGQPSNYSWFQVEDTRGSVYGVHLNLPVYGAHSDDGIYVVDIAVVKGPPGVVEELGKSVAIPNPDLVTFAEVKNLVVYPMLLAQFLGIVHELKPSFLTGSPPAEFVSAHHFPPALICVGYLHGRCFTICRAYPTRGINVKIVDEFDRRIASMQSGHLASSPLA